MKRVFLMIHLMLLCSFLGFSQKKDEKPNFSGSWITDRSHASMYVGGTEQVGLGSENLVPDCVINKIIQHTESEIKIMTSYRCKENGVSSEGKNASTYFTDERGEINQTNDGRSLESITKWDGKEILITYYSIDPKGKKLRASIRRMAISKKGDKLTEIVAGPSYQKSATETAALLNSFTKIVYRNSK